jgi:pimeloyl-ACP methyl ester carboxylesterase
MILAKRRPAKAHSQALSQTQEQAPKGWRNQDLRGCNMKYKISLSHPKQRTFLVAITFAATVLLSQSVSAQVGLKTYTGAFADGATYLIDVPRDWNKTLFLYSHGYVLPGTPNPPADNGDLLVRLYLLSHGYALAGSSYALTGWAIQNALTDQIAVLDKFGQLVGEPNRTIAWGHSLGGIITAGLVQSHPDRFAGALPLCGVLAGSVGMWNDWLDSAFAFNTLLADGRLQVVNITDPETNFNNAEQILSNAQNTAKGRARTALVAALIDSPGWIDPFSPPPCRTCYAALEANQFVSLAQDLNFALYFALRAELEARAGGNPSWNTGVNYEKELKLSVDYGEVQALYRKAGLSLDADLRTLKDATRIAADAGAVKYLSQNVTFDGEIKLPVLAVHTIGDDVVNVQNEQAYAAVVQRAHHELLLRQAFVHRAGHCNFTSAETIAAIQALIHRLDTGEWDGVDAEALNDAASKLPRVYDFLGLGLPLSPPAFVHYKPAPFQRPYDGSE